MIAVGILKLSVPPSAYWTLAGYCSKLNNVHHLSRKFTVAIINRYVMNSEIFNHLLYDNMINVHHSNNEISEYSNMSKEKPTIPSEVQEQTGEQNPNRGSHV